MTGFWFVLSHPSHKDKYVAWMGHPSFIYIEEGGRRIC